MAAPARAAAPNRSSVTNRGRRPPFGPRYEEWRGDGEDVPFTVGNYWPYATTLFDYIRRAMPSNAPGTLANDEVYALTAWLLAENGIIGPDAAMNATSLPQVAMPARRRLRPAGTVAAAPGRRRVAPTSVTSSRVAMLVRRRHIEYSECSSECSS